MVGYNFSTNYYLILSVRYVYQGQFIGNVTNENTKKLDIW